MLAHKPHTPFFSAPLEGDDHGHRIAKNPVDAGRGLKPRKPVKVAKLSNCWHGSINTDFPRKEKKVFAGNNQV
jgi:hypothetical protein